MNHIKKAAMILAAMIVATTCWLHSNAAEVDELTVEEILAQPEIQEMYYADDNIASGIVDEDYGQMVWVINHEGKLTVTGHGDFRLGSFMTEVPWREYGENIITEEINVTGMTYAAALLIGCSNLKSVDFSGFDTSEVTTFGHMFYGCSALEEVDLSGFDTRNVKDMIYMFGGCRSLKKLDLRKFDTKNVEHMMGMFSECYSLTDLYISGFDTSNVTSMNSMFEYCESLATLDLKRFDTGNVEYMDYMFNNCSSLKSLDITGFDTSNVRYMGMMFYGCSALEELDISSFDMSNVENTGGMFEECNALRKIRTPKNCLKEIELPTAEGTDTWYQYDGTATDIIPQNLSDSVVIMKNTIPDLNSITNIFRDIPEKKWYVDYVQYVYDTKLMWGNGVWFNPSQNVTRAQLVTTLYRLAGSPEVTDYSACDAFLDVQADTYYTDAVCWAYNNGVATGNPETGKFNTVVTLTRQQLAAFLYRFAEYMGYDMSVRGDISTMLNADKVSAYAVETVRWAVGTGLISGSQVIDASGNIAYDLAPQSGTTRAQLAAILQRFCEKYNI